MLNIFKDEDREEGDGVSTYIAKGDFKRRSPYNTMQNRVRRRGS